MLELIFATTNVGKINDAAAIAKSFKIGISGLLELGLGAPPEVIEDGDSYRANALLKATAYSAWSKAKALFADDSGIEVRGLGGAPGLISAMYAGIGCSSEDNRRKLLHELGDGKDRSAVLRSVICLIVYGREALFFEGECAGSIAEVERGKMGFGYDSLFMPEGFNGKTLAELKDSGAFVKTHRYAAFAKMADWCSQNHQLLPPEILR